MQDVILRAFLIVEDELHRDPRPARPARVRRLPCITSQIARIVFPGSQPSSAPFKMDLTTEIARLTPFFSGNAKSPCLLVAEAQRDQRLHHLHRRADAIDHRHPQLAGQLLRQWSPSRRSQGLSPRCHPLSARECSARALSPAPGPLPSSSASTGKSMACSAAQC